MLHKVRADLRTEALSHKTTDQVSEIKGAQALNSQTKRYARHSVVGSGQTECWTSLSTVWWALVRLSAGPVDESQHSVVGSGQTECWTSLSTVWWALHSVVDSGQTECWTSLSTVWWTLVRLSAGRVSAQCRGLCVVGSGQTECWTSLSTVWWTLVRLSAGRVSALRLAARILGQSRLQAAPRAVSVGHPPAQALAVKTVIDLCQREG
ncbi:hypothetical protein RRG08_011042 [Elysia crispata]|uniref:Uncharacterized protein n=1 Tax=Elysia crispata TaxID=231223 RepID=A0AAE0YD51_9GAST|nr:hypothetical protein RRG08_011042 [Elysia crispata]